MDPKRGSNKPLALEPIEPPPSNSDAAGDGVPAMPVAQPDEPAKAQDKFLAAAIREFAKGRINQTLWTSIAAKTGGDEKATRSAYLVARATELRLALRKDGAAGAANDAALPKAEIVRMEVAPRGKAPPAQRFGRDSRRVYIGVAAALVAFVVAGAVALLRTTGDAPGQGGAVATMAPKKANAAKAAPTAKDAAPATEERKSVEAQVRALADAGNWNLLVIYANEWTRKEPSNVAAWLELSRGYAKLRQYDEAVRAAKKAIDLAPQDPALWRNLATIQTAANNVEAAVRAYEQVTVLDPNDVESLVQIGILNVKIDRMPQAKGAFDRVLAANPAHVDALCGEQYVAQRDGRTKDVEAVAKQLRTLDAKCRDLTDGATVAVKHPGAVVAPAR